ncbi:MAG: hypothetical protein PHE93_04020 [Clostridia bacterium]|nr:hypothetical protein [Clostridia bacterium]
MKKKGLIISTIVMMLVVVVALSTATYAWFAVSADAKISALTVQTAASDGLQIASYYDGGVSSGEMTLSTGANKTWTNSSFADFGAELSFTTALASAYGVTGNGLKQNMYTAASRSATAYATTEVTIAWWDVITDGPSTQGADYIANYGQFYSNQTGLTLATTTGALIFTDGAWTGDAIDARALIAGQGFYIRTIGFDTIRIDTSNAVAYDADATMVYYADGAATIPADSTTNALFVGFTAGVYSGDALQTFVTDGGNPALYAKKVYVSELAANEIGANGTTYFSNNDLTGTEVVGDGVAVVDAANIYYYATTLVAHEVQIAWTYEANNSALSGVTPRYLIPASANSEYFSLNFILKTQRGMVANSERQNIADIFLKKLSVTASGGMAAAARIAIYEYDSNSYAYNANTDLKYLYAPFARSNDTTGWSNPAEAETLSYNVAPVKSATMTAQNWDGNGFAYNTATSAGFESTRTITDNTLINTAGTWSTANIFDIDKNVVWNDIDLYNAAQIAEFGLTGDENLSQAINSIGAFTAANIEKYYQLVIWFEGTDDQCTSTYAGTGVTVDIAFDFFQRFNSGVSYTGFPVVGSTTDRVA